MVSYYMTEPKFQCGMSSKALHPLFKGVLASSGELAALFKKACAENHGVRIMFGEMSAEQSKEAERVLADVGNVRRVGAGEHTKFVEKDEEFKRKKMTQLSELAKNKDVVDLSRELLAMHGAGGKASKRRRFAERLACMTEKSERIATFGLKEAKAVDGDDSDDEVAAKNE